MSPIIDSLLEAALSDVFDRLLGLDPAADCDGNPVPYALPLTAEAKTAWVEFFNRHRAEQAELDDDLAAAYSKLEAYAARIALVVHMVRSVTGRASDAEIDVESIQAGVAISDWFAGEARRVYELFSESDTDREERHLVEWIARKGRSVTVREVQQGHRKYKTATNAEAALKKLVNAGHGEWEPSPRGASGRPTRRFVLNGASTVDETFMEPEKNADCVDEDLHRHSDDEDHMEDMVGQRETGAAWERDAEPPRPTDELVIPSIRAARRFLSRTYDWISSRFKVTKAATEGLRA